MSRFALALSLVVAPSCVRAPSSTGPVPVAAAPAPPIETQPLLLWRVERDGVVNHLLGTCHINIPLDEVLAPPHDTVLDQAGVVYVEAKLDDLDPVAMMRAVWSEGPGLRAQLDPETWRALAHTMRATIPAPLLDQMVPWTVEAMVMVPQALPASGELPPTLDRQILDAARSKGADVRYLETIDQQVALMNQRDVDLDLLLSATEQTQRSWDATRALCVDADTAPFLQLLQADDDDRDDLEAMFKTRNLAWMEILGPALADGGVVVAAGAGHMLGAHGLVGLLEAQGHTVTRQEGAWPDLTHLLPEAAPTLNVAPDVDPGRLAATEAKLSPVIVAGMCQTGQPLRDCFSTSEAACTEAMSHGLSLCVEQHAADIAAGDPDLPSKLAGCAPSAMIARAIVHDTVNPTPLCGLMLDAMRGAAH